MKLTDTDTALLEQWFSDPSFLHWVKQEGGGESTDWDRYFQEHPHHRELAEIGRMMVLGIPFREIPTDEAAANKVIQGVWEQLKQAEPTPTITQVRPGRRLGGKFWRVAASIAAVLLLGLGIFWQSTPSVEVLLQTEYGQQLTTQLPDGSSVMLNANSRLRYLSESPREVWLEGEAFFEVQKKPETQASFLVHTQDMTVRVLGTAFNVKTRQDQTKVFLEEGKVELKLAEIVSDSAGELGQIVEMDPGDVVAYSKKQNTFDKRANLDSQSAIISWTGGTLTFQNTPLPVALTEIEDLYGITFVLESEAIRQELISGGVPIEDLEVSLQTLRKLYGLQITKEGKRYVI
ncbi:MAG: FecR domain-containing protein, partial [Bacteroidota bacterium]